MKQRTAFGRKPYLAASAALMALLVVLSWTVAFRERATRRILMEYKVHQTLTALIELVRLGPPSAEDLAGVDWLGLYDAEGRLIYSYGDPPGSLDAAGLSDSQRFELGSRQATMTRAVGRDFPGRGIMGGMMMNRQFRDQLGGKDLGPFGASPAWASIRYELGSYWLGQYAILGLAAIATAALVAFYLAMARLSSRYEATRLAEEKNRELVELGQAARTIVHEIKNPLGVIRIQCALIRRQSESGAGGSGAAGSVRVIEDEVTRLASMADRVRNFLRSTPPPAEPFSLGEFLASYAERYRGIVRFDLSGLGEGLTLNADRNGISEALDNLVANALEAAASASAPDAPGAELGPDAIPLVEARSERRGLCIRVCDRGPGVREPERLFEPFYTTKEKGTGLGLALARKHVEAAGGTLEYENRPGGGSIFSARFPAAALGRQPARGPSRR